MPRDGAARFRVNVAVRVIRLSAPTVVKVASGGCQSTAALQDMLKVLRRFPWVRLFLYHVPVQGDGAAERIVDALQTLNQRAASIGGIDLILHIIKETERQVHLGRVCPAYTPNVRIKVCKRFARWPRQIDRNEKTLRHQEGKGQR